MLCEKGGGARTYQGNALLDCGAGNLAAGNGDGGVGAMCVKEAGEEELELGEKIGGGFVQFDVAVLFGGVFHRGEAGEGGKYIVYVYLCIVIKYIYKF